MLNTLKNTKSMKNINGSLYLPKEAKIVTLSVEVLQEENAIVRNVQYEKSGEIENVVDNISRKPVFVLTGNPNVIDLSYLNPDFGKSFILYSKAPGVEMGTVYRIDTKNGYVYKVSHLFIEYYTSSPDKLNRIVLLSATPASYSSILTWLITDRKDSVDGLIVKHGNNWSPFLTVDITELIGENETSTGKV